jgi:hypothetical protein
MDGPGQAQSRRIKRGHGRFDTYTQEDKMLALAVYAETLSGTAAEAETGVPANTVWSWARSEEGNALIQDVRSAIRSHMGHQLAAMAIAAGKQLMDRIQNGDEIILSDGTPVRRKDLSHAMSITIDKHALICGTQDTLTPVNKQLLGIIDKLTAMHAPALDMNIPEQIQEHTEHGKAETSLAPTQAQVRSKR